jgi:hypothetical protein
MSSVNHDNKSVFIHIPKTGGVFMEQIVGGLGHSSLQDLSQQHNLDGYFKWCFVRNPFDRVADFYFNIRNLTGTESIIKSRHTSFESFILNLEEYFPRNYHYTDKQPESQVFHLIPMDYFMMSDNHRVDFIGKFENIRNDWKYIKDRLNITQELNLSPTHKGQVIHKDLYTTEMEDIIRRLYVDDFRYYPFM